MSERAVVFGASSYVGSAAINALLARGYDVTAVSRRPEIARMLLAEVGERIELVDFRDVLSARERARAVLNFAYVTQELPHTIYRRNEDLIDAVLAAARACDGARIIHISTQAVFGYGLEIPVRPAPLRWRAADAYVETKILAERRLLRRRPRSSPLAIVRLGNVVGPGSSLWTAGLAQRILEGRPVTVAGRDGCSNATYVGNVAAYVAHLLAEPDERLAAFGVFHHLAEFSGRPWRDLLVPMAEAIGAGLVQARSRGADRGDSALPSLASLASRAYRGRLGGYARAALRLSPRSQWLDTRMARARAYAELPEEPRQSARERELLQLLTLPHQFHSHLLPGWEPPVAFGSACEEIGAWLSESGYAIRPPRESESRRGPRPSPHRRGKRKPEQ